MIRIIGILPTVLIGHLVYLFASIKRPVFFKNILIKLFVRMYNIDVSSIEKEAAYYVSLKQFFIRRFKKGKRPVDSTAKAVVSPVDGKVIDAGEIGSSKKLTIKRTLYTLLELFEDESLVSLFEGGSFLVIHLRPFDYHRIHLPVCGRIAGHKFIRGRLLPVNERGIRAFRKVFIRNRRRISLLETECGMCALVKVGAFNVGRIPVEYDIPENQFEYTRISNGREFRKGEEIGRFELGSTVIMLFQKDKVEWQDINAGSSVHCGQLIGMLR